MLMQMRTVYTKIIVLHLEVMVIEGTGIIGALETIVLGDLIGDMVEKQVYINPKGLMQGIPLEE